jgi:hypothetical protein
VDAVSVELCAVALLKTSELEERLQVTGLEAPAGAVTAQVSAIVPVNELPGVTLMAEVKLEPTITLMLPLLVSVKLVLLLLLGASQKPAQPARSSAAIGNNRAHLPTFIAAPLRSLQAAPLQEPVLRVSPSSASCLAFVSPNALGPL